jgi:hypothetical protein
MTDSINTSATASTKVVLTKDEKIAKIKADIARLEIKLYNVENDIVAAPAVRKEVVLPEVGAVVSFVYGRKTATTAPKVVTGTVVAVKPATVDGDKKFPAQVKVSYGEGFDAAFAVVYPAQLTVINGEQQEQDDEQPQSVTDLYSGTAE